MDKNKKNNSFSELQKELAQALEVLKGKKQNKMLERQAQDIVNRILNQKRARKKLPTLECGLTIVGCNLRFGLGEIKVAQWLTRFTPDKNDVEKLVPRAVPLGYANEFQLYAEQRGGFGYLIARSSLTDMVGWCPSVQGVPDQNTVLFVALERARAFGYLDFLRGEKVNTWTNNVVSQWTKPRVIHPNTAEDLKPIVESAVATAHPELYYGISNKDTK